MIRLVLLLSFSSIIVAESSNETTTERTPEKSSCLPYPSDVPSLELCCKTPILFADDHIGTCEFFCLEDEEHGEEADCVIKCLFKNNNLMRRKKINQTAIEATYHRYGLTDPNWHKITREGFEHCPLEYEEGKFAEAFKVFEKCMTSYHQENCVEFKPHPKCDKVEDFMLKCLNIKFDCDIWPKWIVKLPELCCDHPPLLFNDELIEEVKLDCNKNKSSLVNKQCLATNLMNLTGIRVESKWNYEVVSKNLLKSCNDDPKWAKSIEKTVEFCSKEVEDHVKAAKSDAYINFWFYECVKGSLADFCPTYNEAKKECRRLTKFKEACPAAVPPRKTMMSNGKI